MERLKNYKTLSYPNIDKDRGFQEILNSPIYKDYVISQDGKTSGVVIYLKKDERLREFIKIKEKYILQKCFHQWGSPRNKVSKILSKFKQLSKNL